MNERRRAGIDGELAGWIERGDGVEVGREQRARRLGEGLRLIAKQAADAVAPLAGLAGFRPGKIVNPGAGVGVDDAERRRFLAQMEQHAAQHGMLNDVGEIAGVIGVSVVHRASRRR